MSISGVGCCVMDYLYTNIDFNSPAFKKYESKRPGDGGVSPGRLSFVEDWEKFAGVPVTQISREQGWGRDPDKFNLGGPCIVAMVNVAQLNRHNGKKCKFYGGIARDKTGERLLSIIRKTPVDITNYRYVEGRSPFTAVLSDPNYANGHGERCFAVNLGTLAAYTPDMLDESFFDSDILYFGATALSPPIHEKLTTLLRKGRAKGRLNVVATVFDHVNEAKNPSKKWPMGESDESFAMMDVLMVDWDEAMRISGKSTLHDAVKFFQTMGVKALTITHGAEPSYAWSDGSVFKKLPLTAFPICAQVNADFKANPSLRGDTTGCGDNFVGGLLAYLSDAVTKGMKRGEYDLFEAVIWATACGGFACYSVGGTFIEEYPGQKMEKVKRLMDSYRAQLKYNSKL